MKTVQLPIPKINEHEHINRGINAICQTLCNISNHFFHQEESPYYGLPQLIFRGITKQYPEPDSNPSTTETNWTIRSGLAVRLQESSKNSTNSYSKAEYIAYLTWLIDDARKNFPDKYPETISDLDILADIQHNGGATCLVDFSRNALTALWFACQSGKDQDEPGYLICYNIMKDIIENNTLSYIKPHEEKSTIQHIITRTYRLTDCCSDVTNRFYIWQPTPINNRIIRQDSIFLFGIEKFIMGNHDILLIEIPAEIKKDIRKALEACFKISATTIYNDPIGYAASNHKLNAMKIVTDSPGAKCYRKGLDDLIRGYYDSALNFFKQYEETLNQRQNNDNDRHQLLQDQIELHFSLAVCYKNINLSEVVQRTYYENALLEYETVVKLVKEMLESQSDDDNDQERSYYQRKRMRAYNEMVELSYKMQDYAKGLAICEDIISIIEKQNESDESNLKSIYCLLTKLELGILEYIENDRKSVDFEMITSSIQNMKNACSFDKLLASYYKLMYGIKNVYIKPGKRPTKNEFIDIDEKIKYFEETECKNIKDYTGYVDWNFVDMKKALDRLENSTIRSSSILTREQIKRMNRITAVIISIRDLFENQAWRNAKYNNK